MNVSLRDLEPKMQLGKGAFGKVLLVQNKRYNGGRVNRLRNSITLAIGTRPTTNRLPAYMALKVIDARQVQKDGNAKTIEGERSTHSQCARTGSPFIIKLYAAFRDSKNYYFLLELSEGGDLYEQLLQRKPARFLEGEARFFVAGIAEALRAMHSCGIAYRDMKLENTLLDANGYPKIADFGLAKRIGNHKTRTLCGTPLYMAPEMIKSKGHDCSVDLWSFGILIYDLTTGKTPFTGNTMMQIFESVLKHDGGKIRWPKKVPPPSREMAMLIQGLLQPNPQRRLGTQSFSEFKNHPWMTGFDWYNFRRLRKQPPFVPKSKLPAGVRQAGQGFVGKPRNVPMANYNQSQQSSGRVWSHFQGQMPPPPQAYAPNDPRSGPYRHEFFQSRPLQW